MHSQCCKRWVIHGLHSQNAVKAQSAESFTVTENSALFYYILDSCAQSFLPWYTVQYFQGSELHSLTELLETSMVILYYSIVFFFLLFHSALPVCLLFPSNKNSHDSDMWFNNKYWSVPPVINHVLHKT